MEAVKIQKRLLFIAMLAKFCHCKQSFSNPLELCILAWIYFLFLTSSVGSCLIFMAGTEHKVNFLHSMAMHRMCVIVWHLCYGSCGKSPQVQVGAKPRLYTFQGSEFYQGYSTACNSNGMSFCQSIFSKTATESHEVCLQSKKSLLSLNTVERQLQCMHCAVSVNDLVTYSCVTILTVLIQRMQCL